MTTRARAGVASIATVGLLVLAMAPSLCCARRLGSLSPHPGGPETLARGPGQAVELQFLGVAGWLMRRGDAAIMTAPFFTNPGFLRTGLGTIASDTDAVDRHMPPAADVSAILVGHAHYDHLMDVPRVAVRHAPEATVYGSDTMAHILAAVPELSGRVSSVETRAASGDRPGEWVSVAGGRIRFMAVRSEHAPHFMGIKLYKGTVKEDLEELPRRAGGWREGQTLAYVIDFMSAEGAVDVRIHFQDSASNAPIGFPPDFAPGDRAPVDVAIFTGASYHLVDGYPEGLLEDVRPRLAVISHWEDFFIPQGELRQVRASNIEKLVARLRGRLPAGCELILAKPGATYVVSPASPEPHSR